MGWITVHPTLIIRLILFIPITLTTMLTTLRVIDVTAMSTFACHPVTKAPASRVRFIDIR